MSGYRPLTEGGSKNRYSVREHIEERFAFLADESGFAVRDASVAHEFAIVYKRDNIALGVILEMPDTPFVSWQIFDGKRLVRRVLWRLGSSACGGAVRKWEEYRDNAPVDDWIRAIQTGEHAELLDRILACYADSVRADLPKALDGRMFAGLRRDQSVKI